MRPVLLGGRVGADVDDRGPGVGAGEGLGAGSSLSLPWMCV